MDVAKPPYFTLIADDSPNDLQLVLIALELYPEYHVIHQSPNGEDVIAYLKGEPPFSDRQSHPYPHLLICDLKMPLGDGFKVLEWINMHQTPPLVVIVLTGSQNPDDIARAQALGADAVCIKPVTLDYLREAAGNLDNIMKAHPIPRR